MNEKMRFNVKDHGYCCIFAFLTANAREKEIVLALELSVNTRTIRTWRARLRAGTLTCAKSSGEAIPLCLMKGIQATADTTLPEISA